MLHFSLDLDTDLDQHWKKSRNPDPLKMNADPKHCKILISAPVLLIRILMFDQYRYDTPIFF